MHQITVHHHYSFDEKCLQQDYYLERFNALLKQLCGVPRHQLFEKFEEGWNQDPDLNKTSWVNARGTFGETILHWMGLLRSDHDEKVLFDLTCEMMDREPSLINAEFTKAPYIGESLLHMAVGNSDEVMLSEILRRKRDQPEANVQLDIRATGSFFLNPSKYMVGNSDSGMQTKFVTPLCVAFIAPKDDETCIGIVHKLIQAGASLIFKDEDGKIHSTVLHHLAIYRWHRNQESAAQHAVVEVKEEGFVTAARLERLMNLFVDGDYDMNPNQPSSHYGLTPLQLAAKVGNKEFIQFLIRKEAVVMWKWGNKIEMRFCLSELDSSGETWEKPSVVELLAANKHKRMLCHGLFVNILEHKWEMFGRWSVALQAILTTVIVILVTLGCLRSVPPGARTICKIVAMSLACLSIIYYTIMYISARNCHWFKHMQFTSTVGEISIWECGIFRDFLIHVMVILIVVLHLWEEWTEELNPGNTSSTQTFIFIDEFTAVLVYFGWVDILRFLSMYTSTSNIIASLPAILRGDMFPWMIVYIVILVASAGAIRVALSHTVKEGDPNYNLVGTYFNTVLTLEEATHGPDVSWRAIVMNSTVMSGVFFLIFLWVVTVVLFNILIAMFTDTFERIREHSFRERMHIRAVALITQEKLMPTWFAGRIGLPMGLPRRNRRGEIQTPRFQDEEVGDLSPKTPRSNSRWLPIEQDFENEAWDKPLEHSVLW